MQQHHALTISPQGRDGSAHKPVLIQATNYMFGNTYIAANVPMVVLPISDVVELHSIRSFLVIFGDLKKIFVPEKLCNTF